MKIKWIIIYIVAMIVTYYITRAEFIDNTVDKVLMMKHELQIKSVDEIEIPPESIVYRNESNLNNCGGGLETNDAYYLVSDHLLLERRTKDYKVDKSFQVQSNRYSIGDIQILGDWLFYTSDGVHRIKLDGSHSDQLFSGGALNMYVTPEWIFFVDYKNRRNLHRMTINGRDHQILSEEYVLDLLYEKEMFYATIKNGSTYDMVTLNMDGEVTGILQKDEYASGMIIEENKLYYRDGDEWFLRCMDLKSLEIENIIEVPITYYAMDETYIYYSTRDERSPYQDDSAVYRMDRSSGEVLTLDDTTLRSTGCMLLLGDDIIIESDYRKNPFQLIRMTNDGIEREYVGSVIE